MQVPSYHQSDPSQISDNKKQAKPSNSKENLIFCHNFHREREA